MHGSRLGPEHIPAHGEMRENPRQIDEDISGK